MTDHPHGVDGAGERYLRSPGRRKFMLALTKRLTKAAAGYAAKDPARQGEKTGSYSLTAEQNRIASFPRAPIA